VVETPSVNQVRLWKGETKAARQFARQEAASEAHKEIKRQARISPTLYLLPVAGQKVSP
jgi:hypothetical protein